MQEEIEKKTIALAISGSKITGRTLAKAISVYLNNRKGKLPDLKHGRQTIKDLMKHNTAHSNFRAMPICLAIGAAGGSAAALSAKENKKLRDIEAQKIQQLLN